MPDVVAVWGGDEWEAHCLLLLRVRYRPPSPHHFQKVPAEDQGDLGVEGFSSDGCLYQCYAPNPRLRIKDRFEDQRDKLTEDIGKLISKQLGIAAILGRLKIKKYLFMVPLHDSRRLNSHVQLQADRVRAAGLSFIDDDFHILVVTEDDFPVEANLLLQEGLNRLNLEFVPLASEAIEEFLSSQPELVGNLDAKLAKIPELGPEARTKAVRELVKHHIRGENAIDTLRNQYPAGYDRLEELRSSNESKLAVECALSDLPPLKLLTAVRTEYLGLLNGELSFLRRQDIDGIAWATTAEWLMECPLDFVVES